VLERVLPFELIEEIVREGAVAEEQPAAAFRLRRTALLNEGAKRRDAGAGADHDDVALGRGQGEMPIWLELDAHARAFLQARRVVAREALVGAALRTVSDRGG